MSTAMPVVPPFQPPQPPTFQRGPIGGPPRPYDPRVFGQLYLWWAILFGAGLALTIFVVGILGVIASVVVSCVFLYKAWNQIQDGYQRTSPGKAVGFQFIPFFNLYWMFVAYHGLAQDLNAYCARYGIPVQPVNAGLVLTLCILSLCSIVPYLGLLAGLAAIVISFITMWDFKRGSEAIAQYKLALAHGR